MSTESTTSQHYKALVDDLKARMDAGDEHATKCVAAMALLISGWRYGDPDPHDDGPGGGEEQDEWERIDAVVLFRRAA